MAPASGARRSPRSGGGFSLIDVIVAMAIVALLTAIAWPSYMQHVVHANRAEAEAQLLQAAQWLESYYTTHDSYCAPDGSPPALPPGLQQSPASGAAVYAIGWAASTSNPACPAPQNPVPGAWCLQATPVPSGLNRSDGLLQIDSQGGEYRDTDGDGHIAAGETGWPD